jgi:MFS family permease
VLQLAFHILLFSSVTAMVFGLIGGFWVRAQGPRRPLAASAVFLLVATGGLVVEHDTWQWQALFAVVAGIGFGLFFASLPNLLIETVTPDQQAVSAGMQGAFGAIGTSFATATATAVLVHHHFQVIAAAPTGKIVTDIPQIYTSDGWGQAYLYVGVGSSVVALIIALVMWRQRTVPLEVA